GKTESATVHLTWTDNANNETGFKVERGTDGTNFTEIADLGADVQSYDDASASEGTTYHYRVLAYNADGNSAFSNVAQVTTGPTAIGDVNNVLPVAVYTKPSKSTVIIAGVPTGSSLKITDMAGLLLYSENANPVAVTVNVRDFRAGVSVVQVQDGTAD